MTFSVTDVDTLLQTITGPLLGAAGPGPTSGQPRRPWLGLDGKWLAFGVGYEGTKQDSLRWRKSRRRLAEELRRL